MSEDALVTAIEKAIQLGKERNRKFKESVEVAINIKDVDLSIPKNRINEEIILPHGKGKDVKVAVFASGELALKAKDIADKVISPEELNDLAEDKRKARKLANEYDFFLADTSLMATIGKTLGVVLGPRGKMPKPLPPTADPVPIIKNLKRTVRIRSKDKPTFHAPIGVVDMDPKKIAENLDVILKRIESKLERGRHNIASVYVKTTMGPAVKVF